MKSRLIPELLRDVAFRRYWSASTISMFGDQVAVIALPLAAGGPRCSPASRFCTRCTC